LLQLGKGLEPFSFLLWQQAKEENISYVELYIYSKNSTLQEENEIQELFFYTIVTTTRRKEEEEEEILQKTKKQLNKKELTYACNSYLIAHLPLHLPSSSSSSN
jgi:hypothetical protein